MHIPHRRSLSATPDLTSSVHIRRRIVPLSRLVHRLWSWILRQHHARIAEADLAALSDRMLADIGVTCSELARAARRGRSK